MESYPAYNEFSYHNYTSAKNKMLSLNSLTKEIKLYTCTCIFAHKPCCESVFNLTFNVYNFLNDLGYSFKTRINENTVLK